MKKFYSLFFILCAICATSQNYLKRNIDLISLIVPNNDTIEEPGGNRYSGCWGWHQASKNKEYAIAGTSNGTYFIDVTAPASPSVSAFVPGRRKSVWREMKTYQNYCYITSDDASPNKFTIVDMQYLPDSVHVVHYGNQYFERGHTIWIDNNKMYIGGTSYSVGFSAMTVWSLATPTAPVLLRRVEQDIAPQVLNYVHDMFVRNDTVYASTGWQGLHIMKFESNNTFSHLGSYSGYPDAGYNHSSSLTQDGKYLVFCDEVPASLPVFVVDVQNPGNIQPQSSFRPDPLTTPHNPYVIGNKWAVISCYQDGLQIYDISNPQQVSSVGYFDTYPQGGVSAGGYPGSSYNGNWGAYPYLPSGIIIASDMHNGVFILNPNAAFSTTVVNPVGVSGTSASQANLIAFPNPASGVMAVHYAGTGINDISLTDIYGRLVYSQKYDGPVAAPVDVSLLPAGSYILSVKNNGEIKHKKITVNH